MLNTEKFENTVHFNDYDNFATYYIYDKFVDPDMYYDEIVNEGLNDIGRLASLVEDHICYWVEEDELSQLDNQFAITAIFEMMANVDWYLIAQEIAEYYPRHFNLEKN